MNELIPKCVLCFVAKVDIRCIIDVKTICRKLFRNKWNGLLQWNILTFQVTYINIICLLVTRFSHTLRPFFTQRNNCIVLRIQVKHWNGLILSILIHVMLFVSSRTNLGFLNLKTQLLENNILFRSCFCFSFHILALIPFIANFIYAKNIAKPPWGIQRASILKKIRCF